MSSATWRTCQLAGFDYEGKDHTVVRQPDPKLVGRPANLGEYDDDELSPTPLAQPRR